MGLDINAVRFLIQARRQGVSFGNVLTIGRQDLNVYPAKMARILEECELPNEAFKNAGRDTQYAEPFFRALGAARISSLDASDFEGADMVHDLNKSVDTELRNRFDIVYDGGTLEHIFQFPLALKNCMEMLRQGGRIFIHTVANNYCGHGFYQFSPELFYRALSPENGYEVERMIVHAIGPYCRWYEVTDPNVVGSRVEALTFYPLQIMVQGKRTEVLPIFAKSPQQSDYTPRWAEPTSVTGTTEKPAVFPPPTRPWLAQYLPDLARLFHVGRMLFALYRRESILWNRKCFRPVRKS